MLINITIRRKTFSISNHAASQPGPVKKRYSKFWSCLLPYVRCSPNMYFQMDADFICYMFTTEFRLKQTLWYWYTYTRPRAGSIHLCLMCSLRWNFLGVIVEAGNGTAGIFLSFSCYDCCNLCSFLFFLCTLCSWRLIWVIRQSKEKLWLNDTKEKILVNVYYYISFRLKNCQNNVECVHLSSPFSLYIFFVIILLVISII